MQEIKAKKEWQGDKHPVEVSKFESKILIVDDDTSVLESTSLLLSNYGYTVVACTNATTALSKLQETRFCAVLTDVNMPQVSGIVLLKEIKNLYPRLPVILMTASVEPVEMDEAAQKSAFDFIIKPFEPEHIIHVIEKACEYHKFLNMKKTKDIFDKDNI